MEGGDRGVVLPLVSAVELAVISEEEEEEEEEIKEEEKEEEEGKEEEGDVTMVNVLFRGVHMLFMGEMKLYGLNVILGCLEVLIYDLGINTMLFILTRGRQYDPYTLQRLDET